MEPYQQLTEPDIMAALIESRGDIFVASQLLRITTLRLDRAIRASATLQATIDSLAEVGKGVSEDQIHRAVERRVALGRVVGLDALHDLASMPIDQNSAQNQVKLAAAARLAGGLEGGGVAGEMGDTLRELREIYQKEAPRLRVIRERTTIEVSPERVIEGSTVEPNPQDPSSE